MKTSLTSIKDTDIYLLSFLQGQDIINISSLNKYFYTTICNNDFFLKKLKIDYPTVQISKKNNYRNLYIRTVWYICKLKKCFDYSYTFGNPETQFHIFKRRNRGEYEDILVDSCQENELALVQYAIENGADYYVCYEEPLRRAVKYGNIDIVNYLLELPDANFQYKELALKLINSTNLNEKLKKIYL